MKIASRRSVLLAVKLFAALVVLAFLLFIAWIFYNVKINPSYAVDALYRFNVEGRVRSNNPGARLEGIPVYFTPMSDSLDEFYFARVATTDANGYFHAAGEYMWGYGGRVSEEKHWKRAKYFWIKIGDDESSPTETLFRIPIRSIPRDEQHCYNLYFGDIVLPWKDSLTTATESR